MSDLPAGWVETTLGEVVDYGKTEKVEPKNIPANAWILELEDIEKDTSRLLQRLTIEQRESKSTKNAFQKGDVLYGKLRPYLNKVIVADDDGFCTTEIIPIKPNTAIDGRYLFYWLKTPEFLSYVNSVSYGLNMPRLGTKDGLAAPLVLAPLDEQKRIAEKLDTLLTRVDSCERHLERVPQILKRFRQSVLAAATSGRLTEEWREENAVNGEWEDLAFNDLLAKETGAIRRGPFGSSIKKSFFVPSGYKVYEQKNAIQNNADLGEYFINEEKYQELISFAVKPGDFLVSCAGTIGRITKLPENAKPGVINQALMRVRVNHNLVDDAYFIILFQSPAFQKMILEETQGSAMQNMASINTIKELRISFPSLEEQAEIVRRVENLFAVAERLEARYLSASEHITRLTPSLLAKGFRGELVEQDEGDESAEELLERVRKGMKD